MSPLNANKPSGDSKKQKIFLQICWLPLGLTDADLIGF